MRFDCRTNRPAVRAGRKARLVKGNRLPLQTEKPVLSETEPHEVALLHDTDWQTTSSLSDFSSPASQSITSPTFQQQVDNLRSITLFPDWSHDEFNLLDIILHKQTKVDKYLIGPSFRDQHQQAFVNHLNAATPFVSDALIACAPLLLGNQGVQQRAKYRHLGYRRAAAAIASLRHFEVHGDHDLSMVLILGVALVTFATHHSGGELLLCRHILGLVKSRYDDGYSLTRRLGSDGVSFLICLLGTETMDCLIRCEIPTMKIRPGDLDEVVDRFIGISAPLLSHFYELCQVARLIRHSSCRRGDVLACETVEKALTELEEAITNWQPSVSACSLTVAGRFTSTEVVLMSAQAKILRLTALLVLHRLRHAFGTRDDVAFEMANAIQDELDLVIRLTGQTIPFVDFAYLISSLEVTNPLERRAVLGKSHLVVDFSPRWREQVETRILSFWAAKDHKARGPIYWDDLGEIFGDT